MNVHGVVATGSKLHTALVHLAQQDALDDCDDNFDARGLDYPRHDAAFRALMAIHAELASVYDSAYRAQYSDASADTEMA